MPKNVHQSINMSQLLNCNCKQGDAGKNAFNFRLTVFPAIDGQNTIDKHTHTNWHSAHRLH